MIDLPEPGKNSSKSKETRFTDVTKANALYVSLLQADADSAVSRARVDAMFDGIPPYDQAVLKSTGQGSRTNLNFGEAQRYLDITMSAFVDLYSSLDRLIKIRLNRDTLPEAQQETAEAVIAEEITIMLRSHPEFNSNYLRLCTEFTKHGVGITSFDTPDKWNFKVGGFNDFVIPRQTQASEESIEIGFAKREYMVHELYAFIKNPGAAEKLGWEVEETRKVILENVKTGRNFKTYANWQAYEAEIKNNDITVGHQNSTVSVVHMWGREHNGKISHFIFAEDTPKKFLFQSLNRFDHAERAYIFFTYGVGTNGTFHSVRGMGQRIFPHIQQLNRTRCGINDSAMLASGVMIQPESQRALQELSFTQFGPFSVLGPNINVVEKATPNLTQNAIPVIRDMEAQLAANVDLSTVYRPEKGGSPYRNQLQVEHDLAVKSHLTGSTLNLFHMSWTRLLREVVRRIIFGKQTPEVKVFKMRCLERGVPEDVLREVMPDRTIALRAIGNGSQANRLVALRELLGISGSFDEVGRRNLIRDIVSTRVGHDMADRFAPPDPQPRLTVDVKIAMLENIELNNGTEIQVIDTELHGMHLLQAHVPEFSQILAAVQNGTADPVQAFPAMQAFYAHCVQHLEYLALDPAAAVDVAQVKQLLQVAEEWIVNTGRKIQAMQREANQAMEQGEAPNEQEQAALQMKVEEHQIKMDIARQKAELDMRIRQAKAEQDMAIRDAQANKEMLAAETL